MILEQGQFAARRAAAHHLAGFGVRFVDEFVALVGHQARRRLGEDVGARCVVRHDSFANELDLRLRIENPPTFR